MDNYLDKCRYNRAYAYRGLTAFAPLSMAVSAVVFLTITNATTAAASIVSARQKTHFFREPVLPRLVISGLIINTGAIFFLPPHQK
ncbi:MAG: hypothetical protein KZQ59_02095 [Candidatus Thiodiazotropha sp. (ex Lucinoma aequizonata)]|nr:hypothetical protein [Candidatus Thiodiazotropha sp. (ex Lucinoma aequizonata)]